RAHLAGRLYPPGAAEHGAVMGAPRRAGRRQVRRASCRCRPAPGQLAPFASPFLVANLPAKAGGTAMDAGKDMPLPTTAAPQADTWRPWIARAACVIVPAAIWFAPLPLEPATRHGIAIAIFMVLAWATEATDPALAGFIGCYLFWALNIVNFR